MNFMFINLFLPVISSAKFAEVRRWIHPLRRIENHRFPFDVADALTAIL